MASMFRGIIDFFEDLGVYDVILPFLLVFSISFAILEKTKILGTIEIEGKDYTRKNYNAMIAFCLGFFVVASTKLVAIINEGLANVVVIMVAFISFMMTVGVFFGEKENIFGDEGIKSLRMPLTIATFVAMVLIFLNVLKDDNGDTWLEIAYDFLKANWDSNFVGSIILLAIIVGFMYWTTKGPKKESTGNNDNG